MTLRTRTAFIIGTMFLCLFLILNYSLNALFLRRFLGLEEQRMNQNFERIQNAYITNKHKTTEIITPSQLWFSA